MNATEETLEMMDEVTQSLGDSMCTFEVETCPTFPTKELKHEAQGRQHCEAQAHKQRHHMVSTETPACKAKTLNLCLYKFHALGDYMTSIRMYGTTDSYSTQPVSTFIYLCTSRKP